MSMLTVPLNCSLTLHSFPQAARGRLVPIEKRKLLVTGVALMAGGVAQ
jgi:hypothetical protein